MCNSWSKEIRVIGVSLMARPRQRRGIRGKEMIGEKRLLPPIKSRAGSIRFVPRNDLSENSENSVAEKGGFWLRVSNLQFERISAYLRTSVDKRCWKIRGHDEASCPHIFSRE